MLYARLRKFLQLHDGETAISNGSSRVFDCGIGWYWSIGGLAITKGVRSDIHSVAFIISVQDQSKKWREKLDRHTSTAEYDLTIRNIKP